MNKLQYSVAILFLYLVSCTDNSSVIEVEKNKLMAQVSVTVADSYYDVDSNKLVYKPTLPFSGKLISESINSINYIIIGNDTISGADISIQSIQTPGILSFTNPGNIYIQPVNPLRFIINTSLGTLSGSVEIPDSIYNVNYSKTDTISMNDSLEISFSGQADCYVLDYGIFYSVPGALYNDFGTIVSKTNSFKLNSKDFTHSGTLQIGSVEMINGPSSEPGSAGNMSGDGTGYLTVTKRQYLFKYFELVE